MFYAGKKNKGPEIMMAPLIDCIFLLLIFFMTTTVFPENAGIEVDKPKSVTGRALPKDHVLFAMNREGGYYHEGRKRSLDEVTEIIRAKVAVKPASAVILQPDKRSITDDLVRFLDTARKAGARNISIATEPTEDK